MKKILIFTCCALGAVAFAKGETMQELVSSRLQRSLEQYELMAASMMDSANLKRLPKTTGADGSLKTCGPKDWVSGFVPGTMWYLYHHSSSPQMLAAAKNYTMRVEPAKTYRATHDLGFMLNCSFGNGLKLTGDTAYRSIMLTGAQTLATRYRPSVGLIRSWDFNRDKWQYPVIIDNMMNLEFLFWAAKESGEQRYRDICISHADKTMKFHFRPDYSSYHVVSYDTITITPHVRCTHQGYADSSAWARGQGWGLYGFTMMYRETKDPKYLEHAKHIAHFILNHPNLPSDKIPYWDFNAPNIPEAKRDASAGALIASALIELSGYVDAALAKTYLDVAETQLRTLSSPEYFAEKGSNGNFILKHSVGNLPGRSEVDVPLTYADYYYVEALLRWKKK